MMNLNLTINKARTFMPFSIAKGTTEQRFQKARLFNLNFFKNLQYDFKDRQLTAGTFRKDLKECSNKKINIIVESAEDIFKPAVGPILWVKSQYISGFKFFLPGWEQIIELKDAPVFLSKTQEFFNMIFNPKILTRYVEMSKQGQDIKGTLKFFSDNISGENKLDPEKLSKFLSGKTMSEKINTMQVLRYNLLSEKNTKAAQYQIDRHIEKYEHMQMLGKDYDLGKYNYDEKQKLLDEKLLKILKNARKS